MFDNLLIANRGEIACRVIGTARRMGIRTTAVFSDADAGSRHAAMADEARRIGPAAAAESYLDTEAVLAAAHDAGAEAVHPGYGFLSENADFAEACAAAGLTFVGPPPAAIRAMGEKHAAKALMAQADVPIVPGYHADDQSDEVLSGAANEIGYPVLIKATSGGGGKGMRRVDDPAEFADALSGARREGKASFGDDRVLIEKYIEIPRHIEIQVFADSHGNAVYLFERDCSLQRRHQKVVEEAPAPDLDASTRQAMGEAAVKAALAIGYEGAGTVEFIVDVAQGLEGAPFFFMEMNTRLQVEHPVTEMITGVDLVEWQLRVAAGEPLPLAQGDLAITGHAIEVRLYAENPARGFLPATGVLNRLRFPEPGPHVRIDTGVVEGDEVTPYYDPMIAKIVVWDENRSRALRRLRGVLAGAEIAGVTTNIAFLGRIAANPEFAAGHIDTGFIERHMAELVPEAGEVSDRMLALAALAVLLRRAEEADLAAWTSADHTSPWHHMDGWRLNDEGHDEIKFLLAEREFQVGVHYRKGGYLFDLAGGRIAAEGEFDEDDRMIASLDGARSKVTILQDGGRVTVMDGGDTCELEVFDPLSAAKTVESGDSGLVAPLPGKVIAVMTEEGAEVAKGDALMIVEAMKMEHTITAPSAGRISALGYGEGDTVDEGAILLDFVSTETPDD